MANKKNEMQMKRPPIKKGVLGRLLKMLFADYTPQLIIVAICIVFYALANTSSSLFMNILVNATQAIEGAGIITIDTNYINNELVVKIKDNGCGIKEPDKIFFAGYTTKGVGVGTGLGLAISQKIIEKHEGKILVNSKVGAGSEFIITIPSE